MTGHDPTVSTAGNYRRFATVEAAGRSPAYERLAYAVADDTLILSFLERLPRAKRQPNLLFAAAHYLLRSPPDINSLRDLVAEQPARLASVMSARRTQTNEAARCAVLLPALAGLPEPLALLEVGAAAGLTLLIDRCSYDYDGHQVTGTDPEAPTLRCRPVGPVPLPARVPNVVWRAGLDLDPVDLDDEDDVRWLSCLVWPDEGDRAARLSAAVAAARRQRPPVYRGDLLTDLAGLAAQAPSEATLVVYHSAVLAYVEEAQRRAFAAAMREIEAVWLSNEGRSVLPDVITPAAPDGTFLLIQDGTHVLALTDPHGAWVEWLS